MRPPDDHPIRLARCILAQRSSDPLSLDDLSREVALSPYHLIRAFKRAYRQTPYQYLVQRRLARAKHLLRTTSLPITEICMTVGYQSLGSFSALFYRMVGISPANYRRRARPMPQPAYIPLCVCLAHGLDDIPHE